MLARGGTAVALCKVEREIVSKLFDNGNIDSDKAFKAANQENGHHMNREKWQILASKSVYDHPSLQVSLEKVSLPDGQIITDWPIVQTHDYVNAVVFDSNGRALIFEEYKHGARRYSWQTIGIDLEKDDNPLAAVEQHLLTTVGYVSSEWRYLGGFVVDGNRGMGTAHFFLALDAKPVATPVTASGNAPPWRWVEMKNLRYALLDGRINVVNCAMNVMLAMLALQKLGKNQALAYLRQKADVSSQP